MATVLDIMLTIPYQLSVKMISVHCINPQYYFVIISCLQCVFIGLTLAILVFLADLYFLVRVPQEKKTSRAKIQ